MDQTKANVNSAVSTARLNNVNQVTPYGNLNFAENGGQYDFNGNWIPQFTATQTLAPGQQRLLDASNEAKGSLFDLSAGLFPGASAGLANLSRLPDTQAFTDKAYGALTSRGMADIAKGEDAQRVLNANQGVAAGSDAYNRSFQPFERSRVDLSNQATINAQDLADRYFNRQVQTNLLPFQAYSNVLGLAGGATNPNFVNTTPTQVQAPDVTSPQLAAFDAQSKAYQASQQQAASANQGLMGGLFGLAGAGLGGALGGPLGASLGTSLFGLGSSAPSSIGGVPRSFYTGKGVYSY